MAYYDPLIAAWNSPTQPPTGVLGTPLTGTMTTQQKLDAVNGWTMVVAQPANIPITDVIGAIAAADFMVLTALQLQELSFLLQAGSTVYAPPNGTIRTVASQIFAGKPTTLSNFQALLAKYDSAKQNWCGINNYPIKDDFGNLSLHDAQLAGLV